MELQIPIYFFYLVYYLLFVILLFETKVINSTLMLYFCIFSVTPLMLNGFLFESNYMPDQHGCTSLVYDIRSFSYIGTGDPQVDFAAFIMSIFPLPFVSDVIGVSYINKFIFTIGVAWLYKKRYISGASLWFVILYPDVILYSSLALKDVLVMFFMLFGFIFLIRNNKVKSFMWLLPLYVIKFQNFLISMIFYVSYFIHLKLKKTNSIFGFYVLALAVVIITSYYFIDDINNARDGMLLLDGIAHSDIVQLSTGYKLVVDGVKGAFYFLLMPFIWDANGSFQIIQSVTNIFVTLFLIAYSIKYYKLDRKKTLFWLAFLLFSMALYGVVVSNPGTGSRYRFPFIWVYVIILNIDILLNGKQPNTKR